VKEDGYSKMEWSCLDWNTPSIRFYDKIGATQEQGRVYFSYNCKQI
ncbi:MAG TPA: GNAT family N-acetyltransferase, partial [Lachnospiraceae bacterium]|nr:GNAT family N-acetyltransferase [Lachnospiraceae bacterium]